MKLENLTPFAAERYGINDENGADLLLVVVKATYEFDEKGKMAIAAQQEPIEMADQYYDKPENSSVKYASDFSFNKLATDVALIGHAYAPQPRATEAMVTLRVGALQKAVKVFGDRYWSKTLGLSTKSSPAPFEKIPLIYELAFGGADNSHPDPDKHDYERRNPVGVGFRAKKSQLPIDGAKLPNIEDPKDLISSPNDKPAPAGFGFISPAWQPRLSYAGTYDETWQKTRLPLLPTDFDKKFFNAASPDLVYQGFMQGNEPVVAAGVSPHGPFKFSLPGVVPKCAVEIKESGKQQVEMHLDKVMIEANVNRLLLVWSGNLKIPGEFQDVEAIECQLKN
jgi:hypothetical protein